MMQANMAPMPVPTFFNGQQQPPPQMMSLGQPMQSQFLVQDPRVAAADMAVVQAVEVRSLVVSPTPLTSGADQSFLLDRTGEALRPSADVSGRSRPAPRRRVARAV